MQYSKIDNGRGIPSKFLPHVFELFKQVGTSTKRDEGGLGIGLAMVKSLAELHGGRVEGESDGEGKGATFRVFLPLHQSSDFAPLEPGVVPCDPGSLAGLRVLLVDDTLDALETFGMLLELSGYAVTCASSAREAIQLALQQKFDLLISDVGMPQMDGYELIRDLRGHATTAGLPAIALTGHGRTEDVKKAFAAGFHAHVDKPVDLEHMKTVIATVIAGYGAGSGSA